MLKRKDFNASELSRIDVRAMNRELVAAYEGSNCPTRNFDLARPAEDGKQDVVFYLKSIADCVA